MPHCSGHQGADPSFKGVVSAVIVHSAMHMNEHASLHCHPVKRSGLPNPWTDRAAKATQANTHYITGIDKHS